MKYKRIFSIVLALSLILGSILPQFGTINYAEGLQDVEGISEETALENINAYLVTDNYDYSTAPADLQQYFEAIGLEVGEGSDYAKLDKSGEEGGKNRKTAVCYDLNNNKPTNGYNKGTLVSHFNSMVNTRKATEVSMNIVNGAGDAEGLSGISWVKILLDAFHGATYATHSGIPVSEKTSILQGLVNRYNDLASEENRMAVLEEVINNRPGNGYARSQATTDALGQALNEVEGEQSEALGAVNNATNTNNYAEVKSALENNADKLGLDLTKYNNLTPQGRKNAVANDIYNNKPEDGYEKIEDLKLMFDEIVDTRMVFQQSVGIFAAASKDAPLENINYITMLIKNLEGVEHQTVHSGKDIKMVILPELNNLVKDFGELTEEQQVEVLARIDYSESGSSTTTRNALRTAINEVKGEKKAIEEALIAVNGVANADLMKAAIEKNAELLDLNIGDESDYKKLIAGRDRSVSVDIYNNRPTDGYTLEQLQKMFNEIVATRLVTQESMDLVNNGDPLNDIGYVQMLVTRFNEITNNEDINKIYKQHSSHNIADRAVELQGFVDRYDALKGRKATIEGENVDAQEVVLQKINDGKKYLRSQATIDALVNALESVEKNITKYTIRFAITPSDVNPEIKVKKGEEVIEAQEDKSYKLEEGEYAYKISAEGYKDAIGTFDVIENTTIQVNLNEDLVISEIQPSEDVYLGIGEELKVSFKAPADGEAYFKLGLPLGTSSTDGGTSMVYDKGDGSYKGTWIVPQGFTEGSFSVEVYYTKAGNTVVGTAKGKVNIIEAVEAEWNATGQIGIAPDTAGEEAGKIYAEYELLVGEERISLAADNVQYILQKIGDQWVELTPNTDQTLWFNVESETGAREFKVKTNDNKIYEAELDWQEEINGVEFVATGREGIRPETEDVYVEFEILVDGERVSLAEDNVKLIAKKTEGKWLKLDPNTDSTLWLNKDTETGEYKFFVATNDDVMYKASLNWEKPEAAEWNATGQIGIAPDTAGSAAGKIYVEYELLVGEEKISLAADNVEYIKVKKGEEWVNLEPNTDETLWFNIESEKGISKYEIKTKDKKIYVVELDWQGEINEVEFVATGREGIRPGTEDVYVEFEILVDGERVSLAEDNVKLIAKKLEDKWLKLDPNTDSTLWLKKDTESGAYEYFVATEEDVMYKATLDWEKPKAAKWNATGQIGIAPETAGEAAGKIYTEYELLDEVGNRISLHKNNVEYILQKVEDQWVELTPNTDQTLWFNIESETGIREFKVKTKDNRVYEAKLDWKNEIETTSFEATGKEGFRPGTDKIYVEFEMKDGETHISLAEGNVELIAQKVENKWVELEPNTDANLWFNKAKETGEYDFFVVTKDGEIYEATLDWTKPEQYTVNFVIDPEDAEVIVKKGEQIINPTEGKTYELFAGVYTYEINADGYKPVMGELGVVDENRTIEIELEKILETPELTNIEPKENVVLEEGQELEVSFNAPEGGTAYFKLRLPLATASTNDGIEMVEETPGFYKGTWTVPTGLVAENLLVDVVFTSAEGVTVTDTGLGKVTIVEKEVEPELFTVTFETTPEDATVVVKKDGEVIQPQSGKTYELLAGAYEYEVSATGYNTKIGEIGVEGDRTVTVVLDKIEEPTKYTVTFETTPENAEVVVKKGEEEIDPEDDGTYELLAGAYTYEVSAEGYHTKTGEFGVEADREVTVVLEEIILDPETPELTNIEPKENVVLEEGQELEVSFNAPEGGTAYFKLRLPLATASTNDGIEMVEETPGFYKGTWTVPTGLVAENLLVDLVFTSAEGVTVTDTAAGKVTIVEKPHTVSFETTPANAKVEVKKGEEVVKTEENGTYKLATGIYTYTVTAEGYKPVTKEITIIDDMVIKVELDLEKVFYTVSFDITPEDVDATVVVKKGEEVIVAEEDGTYKLEAGTYTYTVSAEGYNEAIGEIVVDKDVVIEIELTLKEITELLENLPSNTVIIGDEAFDIRYLNNNEEAQLKLIEWYSQGKEIYIKLGANLIVDIRGTEVNIEVLESRITYYDSNGEATIYVK